jgi:Monooxygenase af470-like
VAASTRTPIKRTPINRGRWTAEIDGDFVVFLIGARFNRKARFWSSVKDLSSTRGPAMAKMLKYLVAHPEKGLLGYEQYGFLTVQYWRSFDDLERFAKDASDPHLQAWRDYWKRVGKSDRTGVWHETYLVRAGEYEAIYENMPLIGLGKATKAVPLAESVQARQRLKAGAAAG